MFFELKQYNHIVVEDGYFERIWEGTDFTDGCHYIIKFPSKFTQNSEKILFVLSLIYYDMNLPYKKFGFDFANIFKVLQVLYVIIAEIIIVFMSKVQ